MQYKYKPFWIFVILFLCFYTLCVQAACESYDSEPAIQLTMRYGKVYYDNTKSNSGFPAKPYASTMGLTVSEFKQDMNADSMVVPQKDGTYCVMIKQVNASVGFPRLDIYIDKKYRPNSCNYKVIKEHEEYHARVQQEGLKFFAPKIRQAFKIAVKKIKPEQAYSKEQAQNLATQMLLKVRQEVTPTLDYVQKKLTEENMVIDTNESYESETKKCKKW